LSFRRARGVRVRGVEASVVFGYVLCEIILARDGPRLGFQLSQEGFLFPYTVEVKKGFRASLFFMTFAI